MAMQLKGELVREIVADDGTADRVLTVRITPLGIFLRDKGSHKELGPCSWGMIYLRAAQVTASLPTHTSAPVRRTRGRR